MLRTSDENPQAVGFERSLERIAAATGVLVLGLGIGFCLVANVLCITVTVATFLAILFDPVVVRLEKIYIRRSLAAGIVVFCGVFLIGVTVYGGYVKVNAFANRLPMYSVRLREALAPVISKFERLQQNAESIAPHDGVPPIKVHQASNWASFLVRGMGSITGSMVMGGVVPFLCFFMLTEKDQLCAWFHTVLGGRIDVPKFTRDLNGMVHGFVVGNLLVASIMAAGTAFVLFILGIKNPIILGLVTAVLNLLPLLGAIAACAVASAAALLQFSTPWPFVVLILTILMLHVISQNVLIPRIIGSRVSVGPVAIIVGMLFWGWLWGVAGLLLAVPLTAFVRLIAETQPSLAHLSYLLAESPRRQKRWVRFGERSVYNVKAGYRSTASEAAVKP